MFSILFCHLIVNEDDGVKGLTRIQLSNKQTNKHFSTVGTRGGGG